MILEFVSNKIEVFKLSGNVAILAYSIINTQPTVSKDKRRYANKGEFTVFYTNSNIKIIVSEMFEFNFKVGDFIIIRP